MMPLLKRDFYQIRISYLFSLLVVALSQIGFIVSLINGDPDLEGLVFLTLIVGSMFSVSGYNSYTEDLNTNFTEYIRSMPISTKDYGTSKILISILPSVIVVSLLMIFFSIVSDIKINMFMLWAILLLISLNIGLGSLDMLLKFGKNSKMARNFILVVVIIILLSFFGGFFTENAIKTIINPIVLIILMAIFILLLLLFKSIWKREMENY